MDKILHINAEQHLPSGVVHTLNKPSYLFPFTTKKTKYLQGNFKIVISELARNITHYDLQSHKLEELDFCYFEGANKLSEFIARTKEVEFPDDVARVNFLRLIDTYLFSDQQMKVVHTYLYNFIGKSEAGQTEINHLAEFIASVFIGDNEEIKNIFKNKETDDILTRLIIKEIDQLVEEKKTAPKRQYSNMFPNFTKLFQQDIQFLVKHKEFFITNFEMFLHYYAFMYVCQAVVQLEKIAQGTFEEAHPLYFALDWEAVRKKRPVADDFKGFKVVKDNAINLFSHEFVLRSLSYNIFNKGKDAGYEVRSYHQLLHDVESLGENDKKQFVQEIKEWMKDYINWSYRNPEERPASELPNTAEELFAVLLALVKDRMNDDARKEYGRSIENLGLGVFLKQRGSLGYLLNINHDFLMMMTAVIVKDERMPFKTLLKEFEKRGIAFDRHSIEEIITLFNNHNILDKKSDSGDAQYVKPIL